MGGLRTALAVSLRLAGLYVATVALGFGLLVLAFRAGLFGALDILFYRGLMLIAIAAPVTFALVAFAVRRVATFTLRDAFTATILSVSLNLSFLVIVPVTVDRSISIFMLGYMANEPDRVFASDAMSAVFVSIYVDRNRQIARRLHEQSVSGNVAPVADGYRITDRGLAVVRVARLMAWLFDSHAGILPLPPGSDHGASTGCCNSGCVSACPAKPSAAIGTP